MTSKSVSKFRTRPRPSLTSLGPIPALSASRPGSSNGAVSANSRVALPRPFIDLVGSLGTSLLWPRVLRRLCRHRLPLPALPGLVAAALGPLTLLYAPMGPPAALLDLVGLILLDAH